MFYIVMDKNGGIYKFDNKFQSKSSITIQELFNIIDTWVSDPENWETIQ